jgi:nitrogen fixation/metabolism regulation signal transduction histidine kinase
VKKKMKIRRKLLLSYLLIVGLFIAAGATITYNTMKMAELQNNVKTQIQINANTYAFQSGLDQKQFGTLMYSTDNSAQGEQIIVNSAETMIPARDYLLTALQDNATLLAEFNEVVSLDNNEINGAISQVYTIYTNTALSETDKYTQIWNQLTLLMNAVAQADQKLADVRTTTVNNVNTASVEAQNYSNISLIIAIAFIAVISAVSVAMAIVMGNRITGPLKKLADIAQKVSLGDLNQRYYLKQEIDVKTGDEIDELVNAFRRMINAFRMTEALSKEEPEEKGKQ